MISEADQLLRAKVKKLHRHHAERRENHLLRVRQDVQPAPPNEELRAQSIPPHGKKADLVIRRRLVLLEVKPTNYQR